MTIRMRTYLIMVLAGMLACICFAGSARAGEPPDAYEPNDTVGTARAITAGSYDCNFDKMGDVDYYNISITAGDEIKISITSTSVLTITLSGPTGALATKNLPSGGSGSLSHVATYTGNHTIFATGTGIYSLTITVGPPGAATPGYEPFLVASVALAALAAVYAIIRPKLKASE